MSLKILEVGNNLSHILRRGRAEISVCTNLKAKHKEDHQQSLKGLICDRLHLKS